MIARDNKMRVDSFATCAYNCCIWPPDLFIVFSLKNNTKISAGKCDNYTSMQMIHPELTQHQHKL